MARIERNTTRQFGVRDRDHIYHFECDLVDDDGTERLVIDGMEVTLAQVEKLRRWINNAHDTMRRNQGWRGL